MVISWLDANIKTGHATKVQPIGRSGLISPTGEEKKLGEIKLFTITAQKRTAATNPDRYRLENANGEDAQNTLCKSYNAKPYRRKFKLINIILIIPPLFSLKFESKEEQLIVYEKHKVHCTLAAVSTVRVKYCRGCSGIPQALFAIRFL